VEKQETLYTLVENWKVCFAVDAEQQGKSILLELQSSRIYGGKR
jgi:hypothetical protein